MHPAPPHSTQGSPYGGYTPPAKKSKLWLWVLLGAAALVLLALLVVVVVVVVRGMGNHEVRAAEEVTERVMKADDFSQASGDFVGDPFAMLVAGCRPDQLERLDVVFVQFRVVSSTEVSDGAEVDVELQDIDLGLQFHLVDGSGAWQVDAITCTD